MKKYADRERKIYNFVNHSARINGYAPSNQEIADYIGCSKSVVNHNIEKMVMRGVMWKRSNTARAIGILREYDK